MKRRSFLAASIAAGFLAERAVRPALGSTRIVSTAVVLYGISAQTRPERLLRVAEEFLDNGVWITCAVKPEQEEQAAAQLAGTLQALNRLGGGIEFAIHLPDLSRLSPYFQSRSVHDAKERFRAGLKAGGAAIRFTSVLSEETDKPVGPVGVRASGVRTVLVLPNSSRAVQSETWDGGTVRFFGGQIVGPGTGFDFEPETGTPESSLICYVPADEISDLPEPDLNAWASGFAGALQSAELSGRMAIMTIPDMPLRDFYEQQRNIAIVVDAPPTISGTDLANIEGLRLQLAKLGIPLTTRPEGNQFWISPRGGMDRLVPIVVNCEAGVSTRVSAAEPLEPGYGIRFSDFSTAESGFDGCAVLNLPTLRVNPDTQARDLLDDLAGLNDVVLAVAADDLATEESRRQMASVLSAPRGDTVTRFTTLGDYVAKLHANDATAVRHRRTRMATAGEPRQTGFEIDDAERANLMEDARHAWGFFETYTHAATGLCPTKVDYRPGGLILNQMTMWDAGSNLAAIAAAADLGLIEEEKARRRVLGILPHLAGGHSQERLLPHGLLWVNRNRYGNTNFDGCDAGRLLSCLDHLRRRLGLDDELEKLVASWDLDKIILNGEINSVTDGELASTYASHCAHYAALSFRRWGLDAASPYETFDDRASGDSEMFLLEAISRIGPLGAEPLLLEAMEMGMSPESAYLADVLMNAQIEEYDETGRLLCVSETPIDVEPWFIYQGLALGAGPRSWRLDTSRHDPYFQTEEAVGEYLTFSTKAAYLWSAYKPGAFSRELLAVARQKSRNRIGFASGISVNTGEPMSNSTDLNTNGIILQAIAHRLQEQT